MASLSLNSKGIEIVKEARMKAGISLEKLAEKSFLSTATVKRFASGKSVSVSSFKAICDVLGIDDWDEIQDQIKSKSDVKSDISTSSENKGSGTIAVSGTFSEDKQRQVKATLEMLRQLLLDGTIFIHFDEDDPDTETDDDQN